MGSTTATDDVVLLAVVAAVAVLALLVVRVSAQTLRALAPSLPPLPDEDCAPAGLGRLVPVGAQVDLEFRRGVRTLELWLATSHRRAAGAPPALDEPRRASRRFAERVEEGSASGTEG